MADEGAGTNSSVGKISLELEVTSDLGKQIGEAAKKIGAELEKTFSNSTKGMFDGINESISSSMKAMNDNIKTALDEMKNNTKTTMDSFSEEGIFNGINDSIATSMKAINDTVKTSLDEMRNNTKSAIDSMAEVSKGIKISTPTKESTNIKEPIKPNVKIPDVTSSLKSGIDDTTQKIRSTITSALSAIKNIKMPKIDFPKMEDSTPNTSDVTSKTKTRGPPINAEALKSEIQNTASALDIVNAKIEQQQAKLAQLKETYANTFNTSRKNALEEKILKTEAAINGLISKSDKLGFKLADLDAKFAMAGKGAGESTGKFNLLGKITGAFGSLANGTANMSKKLAGSLKGLGSSSNNASKGFNNMHYGMGNIARQFFTWMVILPLVMKGLQEMASFLGSALMTNTQFANSLNQIKSNLYTAFMPIYNAILPALNSLMSALATATAYIASFFSQLAGTTYEASFKSAQNLQYSIGAYNQQEKAAKKAANALGSAGNAAKKAGSMAKNGLAGFDEINKLSEKTPSTPGNGVETPITPMANMAPIEAKTAEWAQKFKDIMSKIFDPMKQAWANEGQNTINAIKGALSSIWDLAKDIGKTFLDVWSNGTGVKVSTDILKLLQTTFNIIGDIAKAFKTAWDNGELGKALVQALFNAFDSILNLLNTIGQVFRDVWNSGLGVEICTNILEILKNIFTIIGQLADSFRTAFQNDIGKQLITDILNLLNGILRVIKDITASFSKAWESNGDSVASGILLILDDIVGTVSDIANKWSNAWESNGNGDSLMNSLLDTLGKVLTTVGDIGQGIRESIGKAADTIFPSMIQFATDVNKGLGSITDGFKTIWDNGGKTLFDGIVQLIAKVGELALKVAGGAFKDFGNLFRDVIAPAAGKVADVLGNIVKWLADLVGKINENKPLVEGLKDAFEGLAIAIAGIKLGGLILNFVSFGAGIIASLGEIIAGIVAAVGGWPILIAAAVIAIGIAIYTHWDEIKAKTIEIWNSVGDWLSNKWEYIKNMTAQAWQGIKDFFSQWGLDILAFFVAGPIGVVVVEVAKHWDGIKAKTIEIWNSIGEWISTKWDGFKTWASEKFNSVKESISQKWDETKTATSEKWESIKTTLSDKWQSITTTSGQTWDGIKKYISDKWTAINSDAPGLWDTIKNTLSSKWNEISTSSQGIWNGITTWIKDTFSGDWRSAWGGIVESFGEIWDGIKNLAKAPINAVIGWMNTLINSVNAAIEGLNKIHVDIPDWVPKIGGKSFSMHLNTINSIPALATGGVIDSPTLAMVGEAGKEAVMPLENNTGWITELASKIAGIMGASSNSVSASSSGDGDVIFMVDGEILGKIAIKRLLQMKRQGYDLSALF